MTNKVNIFEVPTKEAEDGKGYPAISTGAFFLWDVLSYKS
jgi:hypothetical protein